MTTTTRTVTNTGRKLRDELNEALLTENGSFYIPFSQLADVSRLARYAKQHHTRCENECSYEWANSTKYEADTARLEKRITELVESIHGIEKVIFTGDPRGYTVKLFLATGRSNTWGGAESGWGI